MTCGEFYKYINGNKRTVKKTKSSEKYGHSNTTEIN
jgi:hypothetical protein